MYTRRHALRQLIEAHLTVEDAAFFKGVVPLKLSRLP